MTGSVAQLVEGRNGPEDLEESVHQDLKETDRRLHRQLSKSTKGEAETSSRTSAFFTPPEKRARDTTPAHMFIQK